MRESKKFSIWLRDLQKFKKKEIIKSFTEGKSIDLLSQEFECTKLTIIRNSKRNLGEKSYKELTEQNKSTIANSK